jgi:hypothetical protein
MVSEGGALWRPLVTVEAVDIEDVRPRKPRWLGLDPPACYDRAAAGAWCGCLLP